MKKILSILAIALFAVAVNAQSFDRSIRPSAAPAKEVQIKDAKTFTLANGLKVFVVEDHRAPVVYYSLDLDIKPELEGDKAGMGDLFSSVFGTATKNRTKEQLNKDLDLIAARGAGNNRGAYLYFLKKYEQKALELMADMLFNPVFLQSELDLNIDKSKSALATIGDSPSAINKRVSAALTYGNKFPSGEIETEQTIENVTLKDLEEYYKKYFVPTAGRLVIVGDITEKEAKANAEKYFGEWKKATVEATQYTIPQQPKATEVAMIDKPGAAQSSIDISYPVEFRTGAPDAEAVSVMAYILGGGASARLFQNLREQHSYTYGVYCTLVPGEQTGRFSLTAGRGDAASVKAVATDSAITQIFYEMNRIINEPVSEEELRAAKAFFAGNFGRSLEESSTIAHFATNIDKYKLPKDYYKNYLKRLEALTVADIQAAAKKYIKPNNAWVVVTSDKSRAEGLKKFAANGHVQFYDMEANPIEMPAAKTADISAEKVIENYVNALGGKAAIENIKDYKMTTEMTMMGQKVEITKLYKQPHYTLISMSMGGAIIQKDVFDGKTFKISGMQGNQELAEGEEFEEKKEAIGICPEMNYSKNGYTLTVQGIEQVNGSDAYVVAVTKGERTITEYYDVAGGLKVKSVETVETPQGPTQTVTEYSDYSVREGVKFPSKVKQSAGGMTMETEVKSIEANKGIDDALFH